MDNFPSQECLQSVFRLFPGMLQCLNDHLYDFYKTSQEVLLKSKTLQMRHRFLLLLDD